MPRPYQPTPAPAQRTRVIAALKTPDPTATPRPAPRPTLPSTPPPKPPMTPAPKPPTVVASTKGGGDGKTHSVTMIRGARQFMPLLTLWPTMTDDSGNSTSGTVINKQLYDDIKTAIEDQLNSAGNPTVKPKTITDEVITARGSKASLTARLDISLNADGTFITPTTLATTTNLQALVGTNNLHINGNFFGWPSGVSSAPLFHTLAGAGAAVAKAGTGLGDTTRKVGSFSAKVTYGSATAQLYQTYMSSAMFTAHNHLINKKMAIGAWVKTSVASQVRLNLYDGNTSSYSSYHTGGNTFEFLTVVKTITGGATLMRGGIDVEAAGAAYVSGLVCFISDYVPADWQPHYPGIFQNEEFNVHMENGRYFSEVNPAYFLGLSGNTSMLSGPFWASSFAETAMLAANTVYCLRIMLSYRVKVATIYGVIGATGAAGKLVGYGIYSSDGNTLILDSGPLSTTNANTVVSKTLTTPTSIGPGAFIYAACCDSVTPIFPGFVQSAAAGAGSNSNLLLNAGADDIIGSAANASVAGQLPTTLGTITALATAVVMPSAKFSG